MTARGGWALRMMQLAVIATYFLSSWAKLRFGGIGWLTSATLERAIIRRGTPLTDVLTSQHWILVASQFGIVFFELTSPIVFFVSPRIRYWIIAYFYLFHAMVMATITISFAPHQAAMTSFLPLEKVRPIVWARRAAHAGGTTCCAFSRSRCACGSEHDAVPPGRRWRFRATHR